MIKQVNQAIKYLKNLIRNEKNILGRWNEGKINEFPIVDDFFKMALSLVKIKKQIQKF